MNLRELINQITGNMALGEYLKNFRELNYELHFLDMDDNHRSMNLTKEKVIVLDGIIEIELHSIGEPCNHV